MICFVGCTHSLAVRCFPFVVLSLCSRRAHAKPGECGTGIGDLRQREGGEQICRACKGQGAQLIFRQRDAMGMGYTYCEPSAFISTTTPMSAPRVSETPPLTGYPEVVHKLNLTEMHRALANCGSGFRDLRAVEGMRKACVACKGPSAYLKFEPNDGMFMGYTYCVVRVSEGFVREDPVPQFLQTTTPAQLPATSPVASATTLQDGQKTKAGNCGSGMGDLRSDKGGRQACKACKGPNAYLTFDPSHGMYVGFTYCETRKVGEATAQASQVTTTPAPMNDPTPKPMDQKVADPGYCGSGVGDLRQNRGGHKACENCRGSGAKLVFKERDADGMGYTYCQAIAHDSEL